MLKSLLLLSGIAAAASTALDDYVWAEGEPSLQDK
jgi:hypothetical protein